MLTTTHHAKALSLRSRIRFHEGRDLLPVSAALLLAVATLLPAPRVVTAGASPPAAQLPGRTSFVMVLDTSRDQLIVFGGDPGPSNDVWVLPLPLGPGWSQLATTGEPPSPRYGASAIYDPAGDRVILYGGYDLRWPGDVWELTLAGTPTWTKLSPTGQPPPARQDASAFYDPVGQQMVVFGGASALDGFMNDAWTLSLNTRRGHWSRLNPSGTPPPKRDLAPAAYDSARERMIVFGGWNGSSYLNDTWALDLAQGRASWSRIATSNAPSSRREVHVAYDPAGDRVVLFGGVGYGPIPPWMYEYLGDTWELPLSGVPNWSKLTPSGANPTPRGNGRTVLDVTRQRMLLVGGYDLNWRGDVSSFSLAGPPVWTDILGDAIAGPASLVVDRASLRFSRPMPTGGPRDADLGPRMQGASGKESAASAVAQFGAPSRYALELAGAQPNPAFGDLWVAFALPRNDPARLELLDVSGRLVEARDVGHLGAGRHRVRLGEDVRLAPGMYVIRLASGSSAITRKALVVR